MAITFGRARAQKTYLFVMDEDALAAATVSEVLPTLKTLPVAPLRPVELLAYTSKHPADVLASTGTPADCRDPACRRGRRSMPTAQGVPALPAHDPDDEQPTNPDDGFVFYFLCLGGDPGAGCRQVAPHPRYDELGTVIPTLLANGTQVAVPTGPRLSVLRVPPLSQ